MRLMRRDGCLAELGLRTSFVLFGVSRLIQSIVKRPMLRLEFRCCQPIAAVEGAMHRC